jgi:hypothetical protein
MLNVDHDTESANGAQDVVASDGRAWPGFFPGAGKNSPRACRCGPDLIVVNRQAAVHRCRFAHDGNFQQFPVARSFDLRNVPVIERSSWEWRCHRHSAT